MHFLPPQNLNNNYLKVTKHLFIKKMEPEFDEALVKRRRLIKSSLISPRFAQPVFTWEFLPLTYIYIYSNFGRNIFKQNVNLIQHETLLISNVRGWFDKFSDIKPQKGRIEKKKEKKLKIIFRTSQSFFQNLKITYKITHGI